MKQKSAKRRSLFLLLVLFITASLSARVHAAASVTFEDGKITVFSPGSVYSPSDLFENFKEVMPGDTRREEITVQNKSGDFDYIKIYLRAVPHEKNDDPAHREIQDLLSRLSMTVKNGTSVIYDASPNEADGLAGNVYLGTLRKGQSLKLDVQLSVPLELGNEYANLSGEVDWVFTVEGFNDPSGSLIETGLHKWPVPVFGILGIAFIAWGIVLSRKKNRA